MAFLGIRKANKWDAGLNSKRLNAASRAREERREERRGEGRKDGRKDRNKMKTI